MLYLGGRGDSCNLLLRNALGAGFYPLRGLTTMLWSGGGWHSFNLLLWFAYGQSIMVRQLMLLWDPEDSGSETHFMGLDFVPLRGLVIHLI